MAISVVSFSFSRAVQPEAQLSAGWWPSLPYLVSSSSDLQLTDFLSPQSYIIVQSPTQSLEWHIWSSSSGNNCHAVHRSLSSGESVYECTMGFLPCPIFFSQAHLRDFFSLLPSEWVTSFRCMTFEWHVWPGRRSIYNICVVCLFCVFVWVWVCVSRYIHVGAVTLILKSTF